MSANLSYDRITGQVAMFARTDIDGEPWHKLGQKITGAATWAQAMQLAHIDWTVSKEQLSDAQGQPVPAWGIIRDDNRRFLGSVGEVYTPIQNRDLGATADEIIGRIDGAHYESAGALGIGERVWAMARVPYDFEPVPGDKHNTFLLATTSHDGSLAMTLKCVATRVVCQNTLTAALNERGEACKTRHTEGAIARTQNWAKMAGGVGRFFERHSIQLSAMARKNLDKAQSVKLMSKLFGDDWQSSARARNQVEEIARLYASAERREGNLGAPGTAYAMYNSITDWVDHQAPVRRTDNTAGMGEQQIRTQKAIWNGGEAMKLDAMNYILEAIDWQETAAAVQSLGIPQAPKTTNPINSVLNMMNI